MRGWLKSPPVRSVSSVLFHERHAPQHPWRRRSAFLGRFPLLASARPEPGPAFCMRGLLKSRSRSRRIFRHTPRATCAAASLAATFRISRSLPLLASARHTARVRRCERQPLPHLRKPGMQIRGKVRSGQPGPTVSSSFPRYPAIDLNEIGAGLSAQPPSGFSSSPPDGAKRSRATFRRSTTGCSG